MPAAACCEQCVLAAHSDHELYFSHSRGVEGERPTLHVRGPPQPRWPCEQLGAAAVPNPQRGARDRDRVDADGGCVVTQKGEQDLGVHPDRHRCLERKQRRRAAAGRAACVPCPCGSHDAAHGGHAGIGRRRASAARDLRRDLDCLIAWQPRRNPAEAAIPAMRPHTSMRAVDKTVCQTHSRQGRQRQARATWPQCSPLPLIGEGTCTAHIHSPTPPQRKMWLCVGGLMELRALGGCEPSCSPVQDSQHVVAPCDTWVGISDGINTIITNDPRLTLILVLISTLPVQIVNANQTSV